MTINKCYESVAVVKKEKLKMVHLKKEFGKHRTDQSNIFKHCLLTLLQLTQWIKSMTMNFTKVALFSNYN